MKRSRGRVVEISSVEELDRRVAAGACDLSGWQLRGLDLSGRSGTLARTRLAGASFFGCVFAPGDAEKVTAEGGLILPPVPDVPVDTYRGRLYEPRELYDTPRYDHSLDARAYAWSQGPPDSAAALARTLHDHAIDEALDAWVAGRRLVGVMGGHALQRDEPRYGDAARLAHAVAAGGCTIATGGGPGAMEAANLGGWLAAYPPEAVVEALGVLAPAPGYRPSVDAWVAGAREVRRRFPDGGESLGIPTWHYGHEPPNVLATAVAKYFRNANREAILLELCDAGIVFLTGAGGTVQEIFQDACENYYADESSVAPMVLVGREYWTETLPAWPLLRALARGRPMERYVHLVDTVEEAAAVVAAG